MNERIGLQSRTGVVLLEKRGTVVPDRGHFVLEVSSFSDGSSPREGVDVRQLSAMVDIEQLAVGRERQTFVIVDEVGVLAVQVCPWSPLTAAVPASPTTHQLPSSAEIARRSAVPNADTSTNGSLPSTSTSKSNPQATIVP
jgi:hypothetical protein